MAEKGTVIKLEGVWFAGQLLFALKDHIIDTPQIFHGPVVRVKQVRSNMIVFRHGVLWGKRPSYPNNIAVFELNGSVGRCDRAFVKLAEGRTVVKAYAKG